MPRFLPDTNCMIAAICAWHEHHERAVSEIGQRLTAGESMVIAAPTLIETYSVLTRLPPPHRLSPREALALLEANFLTTERESIAITVDDYHKIVRSAAARGVAGGRVYDAVVVACARAANVDTLLTFNERDFQALVSPPIQVFVPS